MPRLKAHNEKELRALAKALNVPLSKLQPGPLQVLLASSLYDTLGPNDRIEDVVRTWDALGQHCESHIERLMLWALLGEHPFDVSPDEMPIQVIAPVERARLYPQESICGFTADFVIDPKPETRNPKPGLIIIECDGHDYHGGSGHRRADVARMARDRKRDRDIQKAGHVVLRFTGSQIVNDPRACAQEVLSFIEEDKSRERQRPAEVR